MANTTLNAKQKMESVISNVAGVAIEITIRGLNEFTFSFLGQNNSAVAKLQKFFGVNMSNVEVNYDAECDETYVYAKLMLN